MAIPKEILEQELKSFRALLKSHGVERAHVTFNGGGDEGHFEEVEIVPNEQAHVSVEWSFKMNAYNRETKEYDLIDKTQTLSLKDLAEAVFERQVDSHNINWWDGDGGHGECELDVKSGQFDITIETYYVESNTDVCQTLFLDESGDDSTPPPATDGGDNAHV